MVNKTPFSLDIIQEELQLKALVHFSNNYTTVDSIGLESYVKALEKSNILAVLESDIAMPIRLANDEIYEMVIKNQRGIVAKEGRADRYLVVLRFDLNNILVAIGDDVDPGMVLFELMQYKK